MEENKVSNPKPLFLRALLKEAESDWIWIAASSTCQPALRLFPLSYLGPENRCSKAFLHGSAKPSASLLSYRRRNHLLFHRDPWSHIRWTLNLPLLWFKIYFYLHPCSACSLSLFQNLISFKRWVCLPIFGIVCITALWQGQGDFPPTATPIPPIFNLSFSRSSFPSG